MAWDLNAGIQYISDRNAEDGSTLQQRVSEKILNDARMLVSETGDLPFEKVRARLVFAGLTSLTGISVALSGITVTASAGVFASTDVGKYLRFRGEPESYRISGYTSPTQVTIEESYEGLTAVVAGAAEMTEPLKALPTRYRKAEEFLYTTDGIQLKARSVEGIDLARVFEKALGQPEIFGVEWINEAPFGWLYPGPESKTIVLLNYYQWPAEVTSGSATFNLPGLHGQNVHRAFIDALLEKEKKNFGGYETLLSHAKELAKRHLVQSIPITQQTGRAEWTPESDSAGCSSDEGAHDFRVSEAT